jgi:hypothetical protein
MKSDVLKKWDTLTEVVEQFLFPFENKAPIKIYNPKLEQIKKSSEVGT